jgi:phosphatidylserine decarboxylase
MLKHVFARLQYLLPKHLLTTFVGWFAESRLVWLKNLLIQQFIKHYHVDMTEAKVQDPKRYATFNDFFIRELKAEARPIAPGIRDIACPADGTVAEIGRIHQQQLLQAKGFYYDVDTLLAGSDFAPYFYDGSFATIYLAPYNYHRFHMPLTGKLRQAIYVPGKLFSVNRLTSEVIPQLYSRNERLITLFDTEAGPMAAILVGALIVGSIQTVWQKQPIKAKHLLTPDLPSDLELRKGAELGFFKLGSTVILLFGKDKAQWSSHLHANSLIRTGQLIGHF